MSIVIGIVAILLTTVRLASSAQPNTLAKLVAYMGAEREKILFEGAKTEAKVVWYTSLSGGAYKALAQAFEAKYPGVKVEVYRASGSDLAARMTEEARAKRYIVDALETTSDSLLMMREAGLLGAFNSPYIRNYPPEAREKADKGLFSWAFARESYVGFGYNKKRIPPSAVPKGFEGLLNPALKGHLAVGTGGTGARVIGAMLKVKGEAFVKKLKGQDIRVFALSSVGVRDQIAAGEISGSPIIFRTHALEAMEKGAPVDWVPMELVPVNAGAPVLPARPPHPHAALLMVDFLLGPDGQAILEKYKYGSAIKDYGFKRWYDSKGLTTEQYEQEVMKWEKLLRSIVRK